MAWKGFLYAGMSAISHSCIDAFRKAGSKKMSSELLVALVALLDAFISNLAAWLLGYFRDLSFLTNKTFVMAVLMSSTVRLTSGFLYQRALQLSPISMTVPYLAFTPAMLLFTAFLLVGEVPSMQGIMGVCVVTAGGYLLSRDNTNKIVEQSSLDHEQGKKHGVKSLQNLHGSPSDQTGFVASYSPGSFLQLYNLCMDTQHIDKKPLRAARYSEPTK
eukprot:TRINITY_DN8416_c0_g2_i3.p2 TRINITY_DN8416_c0_g2~~TRINITY_DN8416_c0_g2_i3.p2  ORF type:complete len:241 (+),score=14.73 TRINITY_DN8416_c0_g2_i3:75-725(+)